MLGCAVRRDSFVFSFQKGKDDWPYGYGRLLCDTPKDIFSGMRGLRSFEGADTPRSLLINLEQPAFKKRLERSIKMFDLDLSCIDD